MTPLFDQYLSLRSSFAVSRPALRDAFTWAEPRARRALGVHARRDGLDLGAELPVIPRLTTPADNGGWGELMPVWFKPYERPLPIFVLNNWAMPALAWRYWLGEIGPAFHVENLLRLFLGSALLIPFLPPAQRGSHFLRHGALTVLLPLLWLPAPDRDAFLAGLEAGGRRFAAEYHLRDRPEPGDFMGQLEMEAFLVAEGNKIGGEEKIAAFLANGEQFESYAALFGGLCFSLSALYNGYGPDWEGWVFQAVNVHYRYARFGLEPWARWLADVPEFNSGTSEGTSDSVEITEPRKERP